MVPYLPVVGLEAWISTAITCGKSLNGKLILTSRRYIYFQQMFSKFVKKMYIFCFILLFTSSSPCRKEQFTVLGFSVFLAGLRALCMTKLHSYHRFRLIDATDRDITSLSGYSQIRRGLKINKAVN